MNSSLSRTQRLHDASHLWVVPLRALRHVAKAVKNHNAIG